MLTRNLRYKIKKWEKEKFEILPCIAPYTQAQGETNLTFHCLNDETEKMDSRPSIRPIKARASLMFSLVDYDC